MKTAEELQQLLLSLTQAARPVQEMRHVIITNIRRLPVTS